MTESAIPRIGSLDITWAAELVAAYEPACLDFEGSGQLEAGPAVSQIELAFQSDRCAELGLLRYALGAPLPTVQADLRRAVRSGIRLFQLRGTQPALDVSVVTLDCADTWPATQRQPLWPAGTMDDSLTNSRRGLLLMHLSLATGEGRGALARDVASLIADPPGAAYVGDNSLVCTRDEQHIAYAMRSLLLDDQRAARAELYSLSGRRTAELLAPQGRLLAAILEADATSFLKSLANLLASYRDWAARAMNRKDPASYLCLAAVALAALAIDRGLLKPEQLPAGDPYLPVAMVAMKTL